MYPYTLFWDITLYDILIIIGIAAAFVVFLLYTKKTALPKQLQILVLISALIGVALGFVAAGLTQSIYFLIETGTFEWRGMTFYGGLVGGAACFLGAYFLGGYLMFRKTQTPKLHLEFAMRSFGIVICAVTLAHAIGRIGCLTAGCCHGTTYATKRGGTLPLHHISEDGELLYTDYAVPIPLFEMAFLLGLFALLSWLVLKGRGEALPLYMILYGIWRFGIEFARADDRGETFIKALTPSQLTALLMIIGGAALLIVYYKVIKKRESAASSREEA